MDIVTLFVEYLEIASCAWLNIQALVLTIQLVNLSYLHVAELICYSRKSVTKHMETEGCSDYRNVQITEFNRKSNRDYLGVSELFSFPVLLLNIGYRIMHNYLFSSPVLLLN